MLRALVVIGEARAGMPDGRDPLFKINKARGWWRRGFLERPFAEYGMQRVFGENVLDIGDEQFLMLLLVMNAEHHDRLNFVQQFFRGCTDEIVNMAIDIFTIPKRFRHSR